MQALAGADAPEADDDDMTFIFSVSGGSLLAAWVGLRGRGGLQRFRESLPLQNLERNLRLDWLLRPNLCRLLAGGRNDRGKLAQRLDTEVFGGATCADLYRRHKPDVWIHATDRYHRIPFRFRPPAFLALCSDLSALRLQQALCQPR